MTTASRLEGIVSFWKRKQNEWTTTPRPSEYTTSFQQIFNGLYKIRDLKQNPIIALESLFCNYNNSAVGSSCSGVEFSFGSKVAEGDPRNGVVHVASCRWPGRTEWISAQAPLQKDAKNKVALEALKLILGKDFQDYCAICEPSRYSGIGSEKLRNSLNEALFPSSKSSSSSVANVPKGTTTMGNRKQQLVLPSNSSLPSSSSAAVAKLTPTTTESQRVHHSNTQNTTNQQFTTAGTMKEQSVSSQFDPEILKWNGRNIAQLSKQQREELLFNFWIKTDYKKFPYTMNLVRQKDPTGRSAKQAFMLLLSQGARDKQKAVSKNQAKWDVLRWKDGSVEVTVHWRDADGVPYKVTGTGANVFDAENAAALKALRQIFGEKDLKILEHVSSPFFYNEEDISPTGVCIKKPTKEWIWRDDIWKKLVVERVKRDCEEEEKEEKRRKEALIRLKGSAVPSTSRNPPARTVPVTTKKRIPGPSKHSVPVTSKQRVPAPPKSAVSARPKSAVPAPPKSAVPAPPKSAVRASPRSAVRAPAPSKNLVSAPRTNADPRTQRIVQLSQTTVSSRRKLNPVESTSSSKTQSSTRNRTTTPVPPRAPASETNMSSSSDIVVIAESLSVRSPNSQDFSTGSLDRTQFLQRMQQRMESNNNSGGSMSQSIREIYGDDPVIHAVRLGRKPQRNYQSRVPESRPNRQPPPTANSSIGSQPQPGTTQASIEIQQLFQADAVINSAGSQHRSSQSQQRRPSSTESQLRQPTAVNNSVERQRRQSNMSSNPSEIQRNAANVHGNFTQNEDNGAAKPPVLVELEQEQLFEEFFSTAPDGALPIPAWITENYLRKNPNGHDEEPIDLSFDDTIDKSNGKTACPYLPFDDIVGFQLPEEAAEALDCLMQHESKESAPIYETTKYVLAEVRIGSRVFQGLGKTKEEAEEAAAAAAIEAIQAEGS